MVKQSTRKHIPPPPGPGRPKGSKNKFTSLKDSFIEVFERLGGTDGLLEWTKGNRRNRAEFYRMITKMLPANVAVDVKSKVELGYEQAREVEQTLAKESRDPK
jgi:hypothetical protein